MTAEAQDATAVARLRAEASNAEVERTPEGRSDSNA